MEKLTSAGRSRGRGRASNPQQQPRGDARNRRGPQQPGQRGRGGGDAAAGPSRTFPHPPPPTSAWGQPPPGLARGAAVPKQPCSTAPMQQRAAAPVMQGRATSHREAAEGGGDAAAVVREDTRGAVRGKRVITEVVASKPASCVTKHGKTGTSVHIHTNYFRVLKKPEWCIHQYRVDFAPDVDMIRVRRAYLAHHKAIFGGYIFDGTVLFCTKYLDKQIELLTKNREGETIQIKIKYVGQLEVTDAQQLQVLNLILRRAMEGLKLQLVGRNFFDPAAKVSLQGYNLELWPGYQTSIRQHEQDILLCSEIAHKVMRTDNLLHILNTIYSQSHADFQSIFKKEVVGTIVLTDYNNKTYRIDDVDFEANPTSKFPTKDGEISYKDYYLKRYHIKLTDERQPLLVSRPTERNIRGGQNEFIMLIPELSRATGLTNAMRSNFRLMRAMSEYTRLPPERRIERLLTFNKRLQQAPESMQMLESWNMSLDKNLVEVPARILPACNIVFGDQSKYQCNEFADWTKEFRNKSMYKNIDIKRWCVIAQQRSMPDVQTFIGMCIKAASGMKMRIAQPSYQNMPDDRVGTYSQAINTCAAQDPQILMVVLTQAHEEKYSCIKKRCCVDRPIPSQVVTLRTIAPRGGSSGLMSIATKVVIQMNAKLMGAPWLTEMPLGGLMTVGFDVCHSPKEQNKSYGALVATMDLRAKPHFFSAVSQHLKGQELSNEIAMNMTYALKAYRQEHGSLPKKILFYRDGVGDGQLHQVFNTEVKFLKDKLDEIYKNAGEPTPCPLAFIVVSKRINTRYFVNGKNPPPGTVVDNVITLPERYDFFLVSQSVRQGTVSPTSYNVIYDTMGLDADKIQLLTYKMTHLYYNWSGTCRVPAVCQYAHKLAFLVAESLNRLPSNALEKQLYFL